MAYDVTELTAQLEWDKNNSTVYWDFCEYSDESGSHLGFDRRRANVNKVYVRYTSAT